MDKLSQVAKANFEAAPEIIKKTAKEFFSSMDKDGDGKVDLGEFMGFMKEEGYARLNNPYFFALIDRDGNGTLDFWEVLTVHYIVLSGRPFCDMCGCLAPGIYFSCVTCFQSPPAQFCLCTHCHASQKCKHNHDGNCLFVDNYMLLDYARSTRVETRQTSAPSTSYGAPSTSYAAPSTSYGAPSTSTAIVPYGKRDKLKSLLEVVLGIGNLGLGIGNLGLGIATAASNVGSCSIL